MPNTGERKQMVVSMIESRTAENPIKSKEIEQSLGLTGSQVRDIVREIRQDESSGMVIGSESKKEECRGGYFICKTWEEYLPTREHLANRIASLNHTLSAMDKLANKMLPNEALEKKQGVLF